MSTPVMPVIPPVAAADAIAKANAPEPDSERAKDERKARDDAIAAGDVPPPDISGASEQHRALKDKR